MPGQYLEVPPKQDGIGRQRSLVVAKPHLQEIPSRCIGANQLNSLLMEVFPEGGYDVDIDQNVYKIRAPREISPFRSKWKCSDPVADYQPMGHTFERK
ncbi:hypothetical protein N656DRAFT_801061 [Canariomyces notabilis]|uniref:Uncharacterized protein n=1 Tax=Canariomyces notabilis TaxID=2074819 RepID=A0AAN6QJG7_9PEZI|nr:hypothetical protein N656DRAFT_801061 [Canariomyces arenarius]